MFSAQTYKCGCASVRFALLTLPPSGGGELLRLSCGRHSECMNTVKLTAPLGPEDGD